MDKLQLSLCGKIPISTTLLEDTLSYTLRARLAPAWNKVGDWLFGGRQFLHQGDRIPAVQVKVHMADNNRAITATTVISPLLQPVARVVQVQTVVCLEEVVEEHVWLQVGRGGGDGAPGVL